MNFRIVLYPLQGQSKAFDVWLWRWDTEAKDWLGHPHTYMRAPLARQFQQELDEAYFFFGEGA